MLFVCFETFIPTIPSHRRQHRLDVPPSSDRAIWASTCGPLPSSASLTSGKNAPLSSASASLPLRHNPPPHHSNPYQALLIYRYRGSLPGRQQSFPHYSAVAPNITVFALLFRRVFYHSLENMTHYYLSGAMDLNRESGLGSDSDNVAELAALLTTEIPEGRSSLADSHTNLRRVAE